MTTPAGLGQRIPQERPSRESVRQKESSVEKSEFGEMDVPEWEPPQIAPPQVPTEPKGLLSMFKEWLEKLFK